MEKKPLLSIIIVNFQSKQYLCQCLSSLQKELSLISHEIIIVNNDANEQDFFEKFPNDKYHIISPKNNLGFGLAANIGASKSSGEILFFLNPDTNFKHGNFQKFTRDFINDNAWGITGFRMENTSGNKELWNFGKKITPLRIILNNLFSQRNTMESKQTIDWVSGGAMAIKRKVFKKLKGFDENFFMYYEDVDLCRRAKSLGLSVIFYPTISFCHISGGSFRDTKKQKELYCQSQAYYFKKYYGTFIAFIIKTLRKLKFPE